MEDLERVRQLPTSQVHATIHEIVSFRVTKGNVHVIIIDKDKKFLRMV
jgi:hypothetical protein